MIDLGNAGTPPGAGCRAALRWDPPDRPTDLRRLRPVAVPPEPPPARRHRQPGPLSDLREGVPSLVEMMHPGGLADPHGQVKTQVRGRPAPTAHRVTPIRSIFSLPTWRRCCMGCLQCTTQGAPGHTPGAPWVVRQSLASAALRAVRRLRPAGHGLVPPGLSGNSPGSPRVAATPTACAGWTAHPTPARGAAPGAGQRGTSGSTVAEALR
jgi:hypothetical protein